MFSADQIQRLVEGGPIKVGKNGHQIYYDQEEEYFVVERLVGPGEYEVVDGYRLLADAVDIVKGL